MVVAPLRLRATLAIELILVRAAMVVATPIAARLMATITSTRVNAFGLRDLANL